MQNQVIEYEVNGYQTYDEWQMVAFIKTKTQFAIMMRSGKQKQREMEKWHDKMKSHNNKTKSKQPSERFECELLFCFFVFVCWKSKNIKTFIRLGDG